MHLRSNWPEASTVAQTVATLEEFGAMEYTVVVVAPASDPAPFKYLAISHTQGVQSDSIGWIMVRACA